ncbi:MAG: NAD(P)H-hydrate dehydratase [Chthoniobacter sp.]
MILSCGEMKALEERAFADGITAEALMEEAGRKIAEAVRQFHRSPGKCVVVFGKGHNGGDGLVAARYLAQAGWTLEWKPAFPEDTWAPLTRKNWEKVREMSTGLDGRNSIASQPGPRPLIILDGLLGIGAGGPLREPIRSATQEINRLRATSHARVFALDLPTGLDGDTGAADPDAVVADYTLTVGFAKKGLLADAATHFVGRLAVLPLEELSKRANTASTEVVATPENLRPALPRRNFDTHKGQCGRVGLIAGSRGFVGAAIMSAEACVRAGAGLITLYVTEDFYPIVAAAISPEVMVKPVTSYLEVLDAKSDALAIGPGLGTSHASEVRQLVERAAQPMVVDADALNILSGNIHIIGRCAGPRLLTPHPGEMARLDPLSTHRGRRETVEAFTARWPHVLLLKGARTLIGQQGHPHSYNTTGSPGMATGGMGDILTGVCAALAGQGLALYDAARTGAWVCGRAAEIAVTTGGDSEESLTPTALFPHFGQAFDELRAGAW